MICPKCGKEFSDGVKFCNACGHSFVETAQNKPAQSEYAPVESAAVEAPAKKGFFKKKKNIVIVAVAAVLVIACGVFGAFALFAGGIKNNPTAYVGEGFKNFFESVYKDSDVYNVLEGADKKGKLSVGLNMDELNTDLNAAFSYDAEAGKSYAVINEKAEGVDGSVELYADSKQLNAKYDTNGESGSYFVNLDTLKEDLQKSIFSPDGENVLGVEKDDFDKFVDNLDRALNGLRDMEKNKEVFNKHIKNIILKLEEQGKVAVSSEKASVNGAEVDCDTVGYAFDSASFKEFLTFALDEYKAAMEECGIKIDAIDERLDEVEEMIDGINTDYDKTLNIKFFIAKNTKRIAKAVFGFDTDEVIAEFSNDENGMRIACACKYNNESYSVILTRKAGGSGVDYKAEIKTADDGTELTVSYDKAAKTLTVNGVEFGFDIADNSIRLTADSAVLGAGSYEITAVFSNIPEINEFKGENNLLEMTKDDFQKLFGSIGGATAAVESGNVIDESSLDSGDSDSDASAYESWLLGELADTDSGEDAEYEDIDDYDPIYGIDSWDEESGEEAEDAEEETEGESEAKSDEAIEKEEDSLDNILDAL